MRELVQIPSPPSFRSQLARIVMCPCFDPSLARRWDNHGWLRRLGAGARSPEYMANQRRSWTLLALCEEEAGMGRYWVNTRTALSPGRNL